MTKDKHAATKPEAFDYKKNKTAGRPSFLKNTSKAVVALPLITTLGGSDLL